MKSITNSPRLELSAVMDVLFRRLFLPATTVMLFVLVYANSSIYAQATNTLEKIGPPREHFVEETAPVPQLKAESTNQIRLIELARAQFPTGLSYAEE